MRRLLLGTAALALSSITASALCRATVLSPTATLLRERLPESTALLLCGTTLSRTFLLSPTVLLWPIILLWPTVLWSGVLRSSSSLLVTLARKEERAPFTSMCLSLDYGRVRDNCFGHPVPAGPRKIHWRGRLAPLSEAKLNGRPRRLYLPTAIVNSKSNRQRS
jgi:hypothetical protein